MKIYNINTLTDFNQKNLCLTIGNFDGIHKGHQFVIKKIIKHSRDFKMKSAIMTFNPHPKIFFKKNGGAFNIITSDYKKLFLNSLGIQNYIEYSFNKTLSNLSAIEFIEKVLVKQLNVRKIIVGNDFRFGKNRSGDTKLLKSLSSKYNYKLISISHIKNNNTNLKYSSSAIRKNIEKGQFFQLFRHQNN